jgi:hypothetical protein
VNPELQRHIRQAARDRLEVALLLQIRSAGLPLPVQQYRFHPVRQWRLDFFFGPPASLGVEVQGGTWIGKGGHTTGKGYQAGCDKLNACTLAGIRVLWFTTDDVTSGRALTVIEAALAQFSPPAANAHSVAVVTVQPSQGPATALEPSSRG